MVTKTHKYNHTAEALYTLYLSLSAKAREEVKEMINADMEDEQFVLMGEDALSEEWNEPENTVWDSFFEEKLKNV